MRAPCSAWTPAAPSTYNAPTVMPSGTLHAVRAMGNAVHLAADAGRIWYCPRPPQGLPRNEGTLRLEAVMV